MDDGWFGNRNDDKSSLGDWYADEKKLPGGLLGIAQKIKALGLDFGILGRAGNGECQQPFV